MILALMLLVPTDHGAMLRTDSAVVIVSNGHWSACGTVRDGAVRMRWCWKGEHVADATYFDCGDGNLFSSNWKLHERQEVWFDYIQRK